MNMLEGYCNRDGLSGVSIIERLYSGLLSLHSEISKYCSLWSVFNMFHK